MRNVPALRYDDPEAAEIRDRATVVKKLASVRIAVDVRNTPLSSMAPHARG
jgi:hypothetical protein